MQQRMKVLGMKRSKGTLENGTPYDSTKVYILTKMDDRKGDAKGHTGAEFTLGDSTEFMKYQHLPFPFDADVEIEMVTTGSAIRQAVTSLVPVGDQKVTKVT
jgi:hypothetical protein